MNGLIWTTFSHTEYALLFMLWLYRLSAQNALCLRGSEWTPFVDAFFMQQLAETVQLNSKLTAFYYNSVLIIMLCIWQSET